MYNTRHIGKLAAVLGICMVFVACGGGGGNSGGGSQGPTQSASLVSLSMTPASSSINVGGTQQFTVTGIDSAGNKHDVTSQVTWRLSPPGIASVNPSGLATGLAGGATKIDVNFKGLNTSATLTVVGLTSLQISPQGAAISVGAAQQYAATAVYSDGSRRDVTTQVTWSTNPGGVATISGTGLANGVAAGFTNVFATFNSASANTGLDVTSSTHGNLQLVGDYAITVSGTDTHGKWLMAGSIHFNGLGIITSGTVDFANHSGPLTSVPVTGAYAVLKDGRGSLSLTSSNLSFPAHTFRFVLTTTQHLLLITEYDSSRGGAGGTLELQSGPYTVSAASYVFRTAGSTGTNPMASAGVFTSDGNGNITKGQMDVTVNNAVNTYTLSPSTYTSASSIGRGTVTLTNANHTYTLAYYFVSANKLYAVEIDGGALQGGVIELQNGSNFNNNWASGPFVLQLERAEIFGAFGMAGEWKFDGKGHITSGVQDEYATGILSKDITITSGSTYNFDISGTGRGVVNEQTSSGSRCFTFYMVSTSKMYFLRTDAGNNTEIGVAATQENPPFSPSSVSGTYGFVTVLLDANMQDSEVGVLVADGNGNISGIKDSNMSGNLSSTSVSGSYSIANGTQDGRATNILIAPSATTQQNLIIYVVSGSKMVSVETGPALDGSAVLQ